MAFFKLCRVDEIPPGTTKYFTTAGGPVLLANCSGEIFATGGLCPHRSNPLEGAILWGCLVECPWHHFQYDVRTGENHYPKNVYPKDVPDLQSQVRPLSTYPVELRGDEIWVNLEER